MTRLNLGSTSLRNRLFLAGPILLAFAAGAAHGQGRSGHMRPVVMPSMMPTMMRPMTPAMTPAMTMRSRTPMMMQTPTPSMITARTNALLRRDLRLDSRLLRELRFDRFLQTPFGTSMTWGALGGGLSGSGVAVIPVGAAGGGTTTVAQKSSGDTADTSDTADTARAALLLEQAVAERLANRRRAFDEFLYERDKAPTPEQDLLGRSRGNPSPAEILSGQALNALLDDLRTPSTGAAAADLPNPRLPLDERGLRHINVTRGPGNVALLKDQGRLTWPAALAGATFQELRDRLAARALEAVRQADRGGRVDPGALRQMADDADRLRTLLRQNAKEFSFQPYIEAHKFLDQFDSALVALGQPDAAGYFNGAYDLKAQTVLGLVRQMTDRGLRFAPAVPGDEAAYATLRDALAACDRAAAKPPTAAR
jgi:hypothetical protein